jgi:hypothetical protein
MIHFMLSKGIAAYMDWEWHILCGADETHLAMWDSTTDANTFFRHDERCQECESHEDLPLLILGDV